MARIQLGDIDRITLVGRRITVYSNLAPTAVKLWTATVKSILHNSPTGDFNLVDNITYNVDGSVRKNSRNTRTGVYEPSHRYFEYVETEPQPVPTAYPTMFGELNDSHIGMRFKVYGSPTIEGDYEGFHKFGEDYRQLRWFANADSDKTEQIWSKSEYPGYWAKRDIKIEYVSGDPTTGTPTPTLTQAEIDAKLIAYAGQRLAELIKYRGITVFGGEEDIKNYQLGEAFLAIYKELNGE